MPTTSDDTEPVKSPKKVEDASKDKDEIKDNKKDPEASKNGNVSNDKNEEQESTEIKTEPTEIDREKEASDAATLLAQGKRHLFVKDYPSAVIALGDACSKFSELYGELADECVEAYFNYGSGLLELAREESGVLEVDNKEKDSEESEEGEDEAEAADDNKKDDENETEQKNTDTDKTENEKQDEPAEEKDGEGEDNVAEDDEDVNNLQLAWEMFELAKVIFTRQNDEKKLAETYLRLGEVALESENYGTAITDIQSCLDLQKKALPPVSREIAETLFQLGVACSLCNQFDEAIKHFTAAGVILEKRIQNLSKMTEPEPEKAKNPFYSISNEIEEIKNLLPEIKDKIADMEEFKNETMKAVVQATINNTAKETVDGAGPSTNGTAPITSSSEVPVNDISHLVRKKRKNPDDNVTSSNGEAKKTCNSSNKT